MDFGLQLAAAPANDIITTAKQAEALGYAAVYVPDHFAYERRDGSALDDQMPAWDATTMLGAVAAATTRVRVGALVLCNLFRHPATTAQVTTTLDHLSGGRAILGIGSGWTRAEFEMTGVPFPDIKPRLRMLDEAIRVIRMLWTSERTTFAGEFYHLLDAISVPKPVQKPHPPVMLGGGGKGLLRIAAREADIVNVVSASGHVGTIDPREVAKVTDQGFRAKLDFLRAEIQAAGRDPAAVTLSSTIFIAMLVDSRDTALAFAGNIGGLFGLSGEEVLRMPLALIGTADDCVAELRRREREWGLSHYILSPGGFSGPGFSERFAAEVMTKLAR